MSNNPAEIMGSKNQDLGVTLLQQAVKAWDVDAEVAVSFFEEAEPRGPLETMMVAHMAAAHSYAMKLMAEARHSMNSDVEKERLEMAQKLIRTYTSAYEKLVKSRKGGNQNVRVEHVYVGEGGQAVVGGYQNEK